MTVKAVAVLWAAEPIENCPTPENNPASKIKAEALESVLTVKSKSPAPSFNAVAALTVTVPLKIEVCDVVNAPPSATTNASSISKPPFALTFPVKVEIPVTPSVVENDPATVTVTVDPSSVIDESPIADEDVNLVIVFAVPEIVPPHVPQVGAEVPAEVKH
ncbi:MAG: hypothetical protein ACD_30C00044G0001 [uncultured bacterium]|nr:MAG: hypothetical protein ACD_30C00044G0001 [uncultured bacterium]